MPQRKSGIKDLRKNQAKRLHNLDIKTDLRKTVKKFMASVEKKDAAAAKTELKTVQKKFDKAVKRNLIPKNTAARRKSKYCRLADSIK